MYRADQNRTAKETPKCHDKSQWNFWICTNVRGCDISFEENANPGLVSRSKQNLNAKWHDRYSLDCDDRISINKLGRKELCLE